MTLQTRLPLLLIALIVAIVAVISAINFRASVGFYLEDQEQELHLISEAVGRAVTEIWELEGEQAALSYLREESGKRRRSVMGFRHKGRPHPDGLLRAPDGSLERSIAVPIVVHGALKGEAVFLRRAPEFEAFANAQLWRQLLIGGIAAALSSVFVFYFTRSQISKPLAALEELTRSISSGSEPTPLLLNRGDEVGSLALSLVELSRSLAAAREDLARTSLDRDLLFEAMRERERNQTAGYMAAEFAHELGSPLNVVAGRAEMIRDVSPPKSKVAEDAQVVIDQVRRMSRVINDHLDNWKQGGEREAVQIGYFLQRAESLIRPLLQSQGIQLDIAAKERDQSVVVDESQFLHVLTSLILIVARLGPDEPRLTIEVLGKNEPPSEERKTSNNEGWSEGEGVRLLLRSEGVQQIAKIRRELEHGSVLGLTVRACRDSMAAADGWLSWNVDERRGIEFRLLVAGEQAEETRNAGPHTIS